MAQAMSDGSETRSASFAPARWERGIKISACVLFILLAVLRLWIGRYSLNPDGVSYLDVGDAFARGEWGYAVNSYWSPLYPWLLGIGLKLGHPGRHLEFPLVHIINLLIFLASFTTFEYFWRSVRDELYGPERSEHYGVPLPEFALWTSAHFVFLWCSLDLIDLWDVSPDLMVSVFVFAIAGLLVRLSTESSVRRFAYLGLALGLSYWAKAVMFPLAFPVLGIALFSQRSSGRRALIRTMVAAVVFLAVSAPLVTVLSKRKGQFTFGDSGWLNYSQFVSPGRRVRNWQGEPPESGRPLHPSRKIFDHPPAYEFGSPIVATFPPTFDPAYWNAGRVWTFHLMPQLAVVWRHALFDLELLLYFQPGLTAVAVALFLIGGGMSWRPLRHDWPLFSLCLCAFGLYALVHTEARFVGAYVTIFWMAVLSSIRLPDRFPFQRVGAVLCFAGALTLLVSVGVATVRAYRDGGPYSAIGDVHVADRLQAMGLRNGDRVATIGDASYWAHLDRLRIVAEVMGTETAEFWNAEPSHQEELIRAFAATGARAVLVMRVPPGNKLGSEWQVVGAGGYYLRWLRDPPGVS